MLYKLVVPLVDFDVIHAEETSLVSQGQSCLNHEHIIAPFATGNFIRAKIPSY